jgi:hypothetical protein
MTQVFSSIDTVLARHRSKQDLPAPMELAATTVHLLAASDDILSPDRFNLAVAQLLLANAEGIVRLHRQALLCRFIHRHDLCVVPEAWLQAHGDDQDAFLTKYNFLEYVDGIKYRFDLASNIFPKISRLRRGKDTGQRQTCREKKEARGQTMLIILTQMLRIIAPTLSLEVNAALVLAGYDNLSGNSQFSREPIHKHKLLKTSTCPVPMSVLYMRTNMAAANNLARRQNGQPKRNSAADINKITREDAAIWRTRAIQDTSTQQARKGNWAVGTTLSTLKFQFTNKRKEMPPGNQDSGASPQFHHRKRTCQYLSQGTTLDSSGAIVPADKIAVDAIEHCTSRQAIPQPAPTDANIQHQSPQATADVTLWVSDDRVECRRPSANAIATASIDADQRPINPRWPGLLLPTGFKQNQDEFNVMLTLASLSQSIAARTETTSITPLVQKDLPNATIGNSHTTLNGSVLVSVTQDDPSDDPVPSDGSQNAVDRPCDTTTTSAKHRSPPRHHPQQLDQTVVQLIPAALENSGSQTDNPIALTGYEAESSNTNGASQPASASSTALRKMLPKSKTALPGRMTPKRKLPVRVTRKRKPPVRRKFRTEQAMPELAMIHDLAGPNDIYMCYDRMDVAFRKHTNDINYWSHHDADLIQSLEVPEIIAISGHVLGYSSVWNAHYFNAWVFLCYNLTQDHDNSTNGSAGMPEAITMYKDARYCRFIVEGDLLKLPQSTQSLLETTEEQKTSNCPSFQQSIFHGFEAIPVGSHARFHATFAGNMHFFEPAQFLFSSIVDPTLPGDTLSSKLLSSRMTHKRKLLRAQTLGIVINDVLLRYQHPNTFHMNEHAVMQIAGYPSLDGHKLPDRYTDTVSPRRVELPSVNMETLFARASIAMAMCKFRKHKNHIMKRGATTVITQNDATAWRDDPHLRTNKIPCLFQRKAGNDIMAHGSSLNNGDVIASALPIARSGGQHPPNR